jgi:hypothetical protein
MLFSLLIFGWSFCAPAQSPPKPWEKYNALLNVDGLILGTIADTTVRALKGPYFSWKEKRVLANVLIDSVFYADATRKDLRTGQIIRLLLPSKVSFQEAGDDYGPQTISYPDFFILHKQFVAGIIYSNDQDWYEASSASPWFSFLGPDENIDKPLRALKELKVGRNEALLNGSKVLEQKTTGVSSVIVGATVSHGAVQEMKYETDTSNVLLLWKVFDVSGQKSPVYIHPVTGEVFR